MTKQEKIIVSAYTGVLMCDFDDLHEYIQKKFGRPVFTHELADKGIQKEVEEKSKEEFLEICNREEPERKKGKWIDVQFRTMPLNRISKSKKCSVCGKTKDKYVVWNFCPSCGADMRGEQDG